jgi:hypothetical protein
MKFTRRDRQKIIDDYLQDSGENMFNASAFIDWLADRPDHVAYSWFFEKDDQAAAREYRIGLARQMASGMRIVTNVRTVDAQNVVHIDVREYPAYISPVAGRRMGGGYERFDPENEAHIAELQRQGAQSMRSWLDRHADVFLQYDLSVLEAIAAHAETAKSV